MSNTETTRERARAAALKALWDGTYSGDRARASIGALLSRHGEISHSSALALCAAFQAMRTLGPREQYLSPPESPSPIDPE